MTTPTPEAIEAAARELSAMDDPLGNWHAGSPNYHGVYRRRAQRILSAAAPFIAAQAKAEAWDEVIARIDLGTPHMVDEKYVAGAMWIRNQITDVLKAAVTEGKSK